MNILNKKFITARKYSEVCFGDESAMLGNTARTVTQGVAYANNSSRNKISRPYAKSGRWDFIIRQISWPVAVIFLCQNLALSAPQTSPSTNETLADRYVSTYQPINLSTNIYISEQYGNIENSGYFNLASGYSPKSQTVILVKDAHCNYEAQKNIAKILETLIRDYKIDLVCVEGAEGKIDTSVYQSFPYKDVREKTADKYIKKGLLSAGEALSISEADSLPFNMWGIEDTKLYVEDFKEFRNTLSNRTETGYFIEQLKNIVALLKNKIYSKELLEFDLKFNEYNENKISLSDWVKFLAEQKTDDREQITDKKNFMLVLKSINLEEEIDFKEVENERVQVIKELEKALTKEDLKTLIEKSLFFKLGKISAKDYYKYLEYYIRNIENCKLYNLRLSKNSSVSHCEERNDEAISVGLLRPFRARNDREGQNSNFSKWLNLRRYIHLVKLQSGIDTQALFEEIDLLTDKVFKSYFKNKAEEDLYGLSKDCRVLDKLFTLAMSRDDLNYYNENRKRFHIGNLTSFINIQAPLNNIKLPNEFNDTAFLEKVEGFLAPAERFYQLALERDDVLVENLIKKMQSDGENTAVVVAGGFHAQGIEKKLHDKNVITISITPKITKTQDDCPYLALMMNENLDIDSLTKTNNSNIPIPVMESAQAAKSAFFQDARKDMAKDLFSLLTTMKRKSIKDSITIIQKEHKEMLDVFLNLVNLAGLSGAGEKTVDELLKQMSPSNMLNRIRNYKDADIEADGGIAYAEYLIELLKLCCQTFNYSDRAFLKYLINLSNTARSEVIRSIVDGIIKKQEKEPQKFRRDRIKGPSVDWSKIAGKNVVIFVSHQDDYGVEVIKSRILQPLIKMRCKVTVVTQANKSSIWTDIQEGGDRVEIVPWNIEGIGIASGDMGKIATNKNKSEKVKTLILNKKPALVIGLTSAEFVQDGIMQFKNGDKSQSEALLFVSKGAGLSPGDILRLKANNKEEVIVSSEEIIGDNVYSFWDDMLKKLGISFERLPLKKIEGQQKIQILVNPFSSTRLKDYDYKKLTAVLINLVKKYGNRIVIKIDCGQPVVDPKDKNYYKYVEGRKILHELQQVTGGNPGITLAHSQNLQDLVKDIEESDILISPDTFTLHAAAALGIPNISLWPLKEVDSVANRYTKWMPRSVVAVPVFTDSITGDDSSEVTNAIEMFIELKISGIRDILLDGKTDEGLLIIDETFKKQEEIIKKLSQMQSAEGLIEFQNDIAKQEIIQDLEEINENVGILRLYLKDEYKRVLIEPPELKAFDLNKISQCMDYLENSPIMKWIRFLKYSIEEINVSEPKIVFDVNVPGEVQKAVMSRIELIKSVFVHKMDVDINELKDISVELKGGGDEKFAFLITEPTSGKRFIGKVAKPGKVFNATEVARHQRVINEMDPYIYPTLLDSADGIVFEEFVEGPSYDELIKSAKTEEEKKKLIKEFMLIWVRLWDITDGKVSMDAKQHNVKQTIHGPRIIDVEIAKDENNKMTPASLLWHIWNHILEEEYFNAFFEGIIEYFGREEGILLVKKALAESIRIDSSQIETSSENEIRELISKTKFRAPYASELTPEILLDWLIKEKLLPSAHLIDINLYRAADLAEKDRITESIAEQLYPQLENQDEDAYSVYKIHITNLIKELIDRMMLLEDMVPGIEGLPKILDKTAGINMDQWATVIKKEGLTGLYLQRYLEKLVSTLQSTVNKINEIEDLRTRIKPGGYELKYVDCFNFNNDLKHYPLIRRNLYRIIKVEPSELKRPHKMTVRHSLNFWNAYDWEESLDFLAKFPGIREESTYTQGRPLGSVILEVNADVCIAFAEDVVSSVNPYTGEKVVEEDYLELGIDPEEYLKNQTKFINTGMHKRSDELFARFNIFKDLKRVIVSDIGGPLLVASVKEKLSELGLGNVPVILESEADKEENMASGQKPSISSTGVGDEAMANRNILIGILDIALKQGKIDKTEYNRRVKEYDENGASISEDIELDVDNQNVYTINGQKVIVMDNVDILSTTEEGEQYASAGLRRSVIYITRKKFDECKAQGTLEQIIRHEQAEVEYLRKKALEMFKGVPEQDAYEQMSQLLKSGTGEAVDIIKQAHEYAKRREISDTELVGLLFSRHRHFTGTDVLPLSIAGKKIDFFENRNNYIDALKQIVIKIYGGILEIGEEQYGEDIIKTVLIRDMYGNRFVVIMKNGIVCEVAVQAKDLFNRGYRFEIIDDDRIREIMHGKLIEHIKMYYSGNPIGKFAPRKEAQIMAGFLTEPEVREAKDMIFGDSLLLHLLKYSGVTFLYLINFRDFIVIEQPKDYAGYYSPSKREIGTYYGRKSNAALYAHEVAHHIFSRLKNEEPQIFSKIQRHFNEDRHKELFEWLRKTKLYRYLDDSDRNDEAFAFIVGAVFSRKTIEPHSGYRITYRDIKLLLDLGILPEKTYGNPQLFEGVDLNSPLPAIFHQVAELYLITDDISNIFSNELILKAIKNDIKNKGIGSLTALSQWMIIKGYFKELEELLININLDEATNYTGKEEEILLILLYLYHSWPKTDKRNIENIFNLLAIQLQSDTSTETFSRVFAQEGLDIQQLKRYLEMHVDNEELKQIFKSMIESIMMRIEKRSSIISMFGDRELPVLYRALGVISFLLGEEEMSKDLFKKSEELEFIAEITSRHKLIEIFGKEAVSEEEKERRFRDAVEGEGFEYNNEIRIFISEFVKNIQKNEPVLPIIKLLPMLSQNNKIIYKDKIIPINPIGIEGSIAKTNISLGDIKNLKVEVKEIKLPWRWRIKLWFANLNNSLIKIVKSFFVKGESEISSSREPPKSAIMPWLRDASKWVAIKVFGMNKQNADDYFNPINGLYNTELGPILENIIGLGIFAGAFKLLSSYVAGALLGSLIPYAGLIALPVTALIFTLLHLEKIDNKWMIKDFGGRFIAGLLIFALFMFIFTGITIIHLSFVTAILMAYISSLPIHTLINILKVGEEEQGLPKVVKQVDDFILLISKFLLNNAKINLDGDEKYFIETLYTQLANAQIGKKGIIIKYGNKNLVIDSNGAVSISKDIQGVKTKLIYGREYNLIYIMKFGDYVYMLHKYHDEYLMEVFKSENVAGLPVGEMRIRVNESGDIFVADVNVNPNLRKSGVATQMVKIVSDIFSSAENMSGAIGNLVTLQQLYDVIPAEYKNINEIRQIERMRNINNQSNVKSKSDKQRFLTVRIIKALDNGWEPSQEILTNTVLGKLRKRAGFTENMQLIPQGWSIVLKSSRAERISSVVKERISVNVSEKMFLPPYTGSGNTSIHAALADAKERMDQGFQYFALKRLEELKKDLIAAQEAGDTVGLMDKWNEYYPSDMPVDLMLDDIPAAINETETLLSKIDKDKVIADEVETKGFLRRQTNLEKLNSEFKEVIELYGYVPFKKLYNAPVNSKPSEFDILINEYLPALRKGFLTPGEFTFYWAGLVELGESDRGQENWLLFSEGIPALRRTFTPQELRAYWADLVKFGKTTKGMSWLLPLSLIYVIPALKHLINSGEDLRQIGEELVEFKATYTFALAIYKFGIPVLKHLINSKEDLRKIGNEMIRLYNAVKKPLRIFEKTIPALKDIINSKEDLKQVNNDLIELDRLVEGNSYTIFEFYIPSLRECFTSEELKSYWPILVELCKIAGKNGIDPLMHSIPALKHLINSEEDFRRIGNELVRLCKDTGEKAIFLIGNGIPALKGLINSGEDLKGIGNELIGIGKTSVLESIEEHRHLFSFAINKLIKSKEDLRQSWKDLVDLRQAVGGDIFTLLINLEIALTAETFQFCWPGLIRLGIAAGENAPKLFQDGLPAVKNLFTEIEFKTYWSDLVRSGIDAGGNAPILFKDGLIPIKHIIKDKASLNQIGDNLILLGITAGGNALTLFKYGLPAVKHLIKDSASLKQIGDDLILLGITAGENAQMLFQDGLPLVQHIITDKESLNQIGNDLVRLSVAAGENAPKLFQDGLPAVKNLFTETEFKTYWPDLVRLGITAGGNAPILFKDGLIPVKHLIKDSASLNQIGDDLLKILQLTQGTESKTLKAIESLSGLLKQYPSSWRTFIKPVIYNQTQGAFLCLQAVRKLYDLRAIEQEKDLDFLREFIQQQGIRAYDLLENFLVKGIKEGIIAKPISKEEDSINKFMQEVPYAIIEIYKAYKDNPAQAEELKQRCISIHKAIIEGDATGVEKDSLFSAMLMYVFPPAVTTQREQYFNLYKNRPDRPQDTKDISAFLQGQEFEVSTGSYILKDPSKSLDQTSWQTMLKVISEVNIEENLTMNKEEVIALGRDLLEKWQEGSLYNNREDLFRKVYRYFRVFRGQILPDSLGTIQQIMAIKQFVGDTLRDLVGECINQYKEANEGEYQKIISKMFKSSIDNPQGKASAIVNVLTHFKNNPEEAKKRVSAVLKIEDEDTFEKVWQDIKDKTDKKEIATVLSQITFAVQPGKEAVTISHLLQGSEYKSMQSEVSNKYEFHAIQEKLKLRFEVSKCKAHGVIGLNMGVCIAPDEKLWDNPNFMNVIIWDENNIAQGGMHLLIIEDNGQRYLILPGINPSIDLLTQVASDDIYNHLIIYAKDLAKALNCQGVLIPTNAAIHSNRAEIQRVIGSKGYKEFALSQIHQFSYKPYKYSFQDCFVVYSAEVSAYFGEKGQEAINPQVKKIMSDPTGKDFYCLYKTNDEGIKGNLSEVEKYRSLIEKAKDGLVNEHPNLSGYDVVIVRGVNFSGHYGRSRQRIYIPLELLEAIQQTAVKLQTDILEDFIKHEYLESTGLSHEETMAQCRADINKKAQRLYREYVIQKMLKEIERVESAKGLKRELAKILKIVQSGEEITLKDVNPKELLLSIAENERLELAPKIARLLDLIMDDNYAGNRGRIVLSIEKAILDALPEKSEYGLEEYEAEEKILRTAIELGKKRGIDPKEIQSVFDLFKQGMDLLTMDPELDPGQIDGSYLTLIEEIAELTGINTNVIQKAFKKGFGLDITVRDLISKGKDIEGSNLKKAARNLNAYNGLWKDTRAIVKVLPDSTRENLEPAMVVLPLSTLKNMPLVGLKSVLNNIKGTDSVKLGIRVPEGKESEVNSWLEQFWELRDGIILLPEDIKKANDKLRSMNYVNISFVADEKEAKNLPAGSKVFNVDKDSAFHAVFLFGLMYAVNDNREEYYNFLISLGYESDEAKYIAEQMQKREFFVIKLVRISDILKEFQNRRITIEIAA